MDELEALTAQNSKVHLTIALNYGGRDEVTRAAQRMAADVESGTLAAKDVTPRSWRGIWTRIYCPIQIW